jgi:hypothetical protein
VLTALFDAWWGNHGNTALKASELAEEVTLLMRDERRKKNDGPPSRQIVASFLSKHAGTRIGGYFLEHIAGDRPSRPTAYYRLSYAPKQEGAS